MKKKKKQRDPASAPRAFRRFFNGLMASAANQTVPGALTDSGGRQRKKSQQREPRVEEDRMMERAGERVR